MFRHVVVEFFSADYAVLRITFSAGKRFAAAWADLDRKNLFFFEIFDAHPLPAENIAAAGHEFFGDQLGRSRPRFHVGADFRGPFPQKKFMQLRRLFCIDFFEIDINPDASAIGAIVDSQCVAADIIMNSQILIADGAPGQCLNRVGQAGLGLSDDAELFYLAELVEPEIDHGNADRNAGSSYRAFIAQLICFFYLFEKFTVIHFVSLRDFDCEYYFTSQQIMQCPLNRLRNIVYWPLETARGGNMKKISVAITILVLMLGLTQVDAAESLYADFVSALNEFHECEDHDQSFIYHSRMEKLANKLMWLALDRKDCLNFAANSVYFSQDVTENLEVHGPYADDTFHTCEFPHLRIHLAGLHTLYVNFAENRRPEHLEFYIFPGTGPRSGDHKPQKVTLNDKNELLLSPFDGKNLATLFAIAKNPQDKYYRKYVWIVEF